MIQDGGFNLDRVTTFVGPGAGPRWLVASGFDLSLLRTGVLGRNNPVLLAGTSAGALRFAAWIQPEPEKSYADLIDAYISMSFTRRDRAKSILRSISEVINSFMEDDAIPFALASKRYRLAITAARAKGMMATEIKPLQGFALALAFIFNAVHPIGLTLFFQRVVFHNCPIPPKFCLRNGFRGKAIPLNRANIKYALLASSAIPVVASGVRNIYGAPNGTYRDGGITDYHLNQNYGAKKEDVVLLFQHQERIIPGWLDKKLIYRQVPAENLDNLLMIYPTGEFIKTLPGGDIPQRKDFKTFVDKPSLRIKNWKDAVSRSAHLGEQFLELVESNKLRDVVKVI
jgi:hypothetical protein